MPETTELEELRRLAEAETGMILSGDRAARFQDAVAKMHLRPANVNARTALLERLTAELTIGETYFFRNEHHFQALREQVINDILQENAAKRQVRVWSAGCATGEEPYSVAILLDQVMADKGQWQVTVLATDINQAFLERARQGLYRQWSFRQTEIHRERRYFTPEDDAFRLAAALRERVRFMYLNLVKDVYPSPLTGTLGLDLILFRNVAIYLKPEVTRAIIDRFRLALRPGGWLLLGESEMNMVPAEHFDSVRIGQATFYRKKRGRAESNEIPVPFPAPILAPASTKPTSPGVTMPSFVPLPVWSALPAKRPRVVEPQQSVWDRVENSLARGGFADAERALDTVPAAKERARLRLRYVQRLLTCAEQGQARRMLDLCLREDAMLIEAHLLLASFAEEAEDLNNAAQAYRQALYIDRHCPMAHFHLALVEQQRGDAAAAARSLKTTMKLIEHKDPQALVDHGEGICYGRLKEMLAVLSNP